MISKDLKKRLITSVALIILLFLAFNNLYILIISLIFVLVISWMEFQRLISKIFKSNFYKLSINIFFFMYLTLFSIIIFLGLTHDSFKIIMLFLFLICIVSDIGGLLFGKIFKGKKLTKISPNKTISGSIGSFIMSLILIPIFYFVLNYKFTNLFDLITISILVSLFCQLGDLFISYIKRKAKVKDTGNILPGHGGILDRIDGMLFAIPLGTIISKFLII